MVRFPAAREPEFDGDGDRHKSVEHGADLGRGGPQCDVQSIERPAVQGESDRCRRALKKPTGLGAGAVVHDVTHLAIATVVAAGLVHDTETVPTARLIWISR